MKISSLQENLKNGLNSVSHIAGKNVNLPILNNILLKAQNGNITLTTTDLEIGVVSKIRGKISEEGSITVESKILSDYIALLPNKKIDIELSKDNLKVLSDNYKTSLKGQAAEEFPLIPEVPKDNPYEADIEQFRKAISQLIFSVSPSNSRVELTGVYFLITQKQITMAATDSFRLAETIINVKNNNSQERAIIIPAKTLQEVVRIISSTKQESVDEEKVLKFYLSDNQILFEIGSTEIVSRLIEGQYPDYQQIIPQSSKTQAVLERAEFIRAIKAASLFSKTGINDVNLDFPTGKNKIIITAESGQTGENITKLDGSITGSDNGIVVNHRYLLDGLNNIDDEKINLSVIDGNTPCVVKAAGSNNYRYVVMPIKQ